VEKKSFSRNRLACLLVLALAPVSGELSAEQSANADENAHGDTRPINRIVAGSFKCMAVPDCSIAMILT
jgi:hypothetical protein